MTKRQLIAASLRTWLPLAVLATLLSGMIIALMQINARATVNSPQTQLAEDGATRLAAGGDAASILPAPTNIGSSLAPFVLVYDTNDKLVAGSAKLDGADPVLPPGVIDYARRHDSNTVTWQPRGGLRFAVVAKTAGTNGEVVVAGRSLRETEALKDKLTFELLLGWAVTLGVTFFAVMAMQAPTKKS